MFIVALILHALPCSFLFLPPSSFFFTFLALLTPILLCLLMTASVRDFVFVQYVYFYLSLCPLQLLQHGSTAVLWEPDLLQVMEAVERRGVKELSEESVRALRLLLTQVHPFTVCTHMHAQTHTHTDKIM